MFEQTKLKFGYNALEPHIDELTMITHYSKHHAAYTKNFNDAVAKLPADWQALSVEEILARLNEIDDAALKNALKNNGGGYYNHNLYFETLTPGGSEPQGALKERIVKDFGSFDELKEKLYAAAMGQFGSGWAWLCADKSGKLLITSTSNQDSPITFSRGELAPILGIDVWEHAYYLKYKNLRADYVKALFNVIDWEAVGQKYNDFINK